MDDGGVELANIHTQSDGGSLAFCLSARGADNNPETIHALCDVRSALSATRLLTQ